MTTSPDTNARKGGRPFVLRLPPPLRARLRAEAGRQYQSEAAIVRQALVAHFARLDAMRRKGGR